MNWTSQIDDYCERVGPNFWAEPLNAITNGAFVIAGLVLLAFARRTGRLDGPVTYLGILICVIGVGSFLFHTFATRWAAVADVAPIMLFILSFFTISLHQYFHLSWGYAILATVGFLGALLGLAEILQTTVGNSFGGSHSYFPALLALIVVGAALRVREHPSSATLFVAAGLLALSLTFRTIDGPICEILPIGTHFLWHILNACVLGSLLYGLIRHGRAAAANPATG